MGLADIYQRETDAAIDAMQLRPLETKPAAKWNGWSAPLRAVPAAAAEALGGAAEIGTAAARSLIALRDASPEQLRQINAQGLHGISGETDVSRAIRDASHFYRPDPATAGTAEQLVFGIGRVATKAVGYGLTMGPLAIPALMADEGLTAADDLMREGVDKSTAADVGGVMALATGVGAFIPVAGAAKGFTLANIAKVAGLAAVSGPATFAAQQQMTRTILEHANYGELAKQYDPLDPLGIVTSAAAPMILGGFALRGAKTPSGAPRPGEAPPVAEAPRSEPVQAPAMPREAVDAAMVHNLTLRGDRTESRLAGVASMIARGAQDDGVGVTEPVLAAAQRVREFLSGPAADALDNRARVGIGDITDAASQRIAHGTGLNIPPGTRQELPAPAVRHSMKGHPNLTADDWATLPWLAENFERAVLLKTERGDQGPRIALAALDPATGYAYVAEYNTGKNKGGDRLRLVTFFRDHPNAVESWLRTNGRPPDGGGTGGGTPDAPVLPNGPEALTSETGSGGYATVTPKDAIDTLNRPAGATATVVTERGLTAPLGKPSTDPLLASVADRIAAVEAKAPDTPVRLDDAGRQVSAAEEMAAIRKAAAEGSDLELGALDADLIRVAADCSLSAA